MTLKGRLDLLSGWFFAALFIIIFLGALFGSKLIVCWIASPVLLMGIAWLAFVKIPAIPAVVLDTFKRNSLGFSLFLLGVYAALFLFALVFTYGLINFSASCMFDVSLKNWLRQNF